MTAVLFMKKKFGDSRNPSYFVGVGMSMGANVMLKAAGE
jgi:hypothetical protein